MSLEGILSLMSCMLSYGEVRQFLTSVAADQILRNAQGGVPQGITGVASHGPIHAAIDNFHHIEETLDGKQFLA